MSRRRTDSLTPSRGGRRFGRRRFLGAAASVATALAGVGCELSRRHDGGEGPPDSAPPVVDTHMHVWANDASRFPYAHPYVAPDTGLRGDGSVETLIADMDRHGCTHCVLVQVIHHGWDNRYVAACVRRYPRRLRAHGLIDPTDPKVADRLEYWMKEHGLHGMRFSAIYYRNGGHGGDSWLDAPETHELWRRAASLGAVFNFFIHCDQLPRLARMVEAHPDVPVVVDHLGQVELGQEDPEPDFRRLIDIARYESVRVKVSELTSVSASGVYPFEDAWPYVKRVHEAFGPDRLLWGTGYPGGARAEYERPALDREIELIRSVIPFFTDEDREKILGRNAARLWGFV